MRYIIGFLMLFLFGGCIIEPSEPTMYLVKVIDYDLNCSTCIVEFPDDSAYIKNQFGKSYLNRYNAVNLNRSDYSINQQLLVDVASVPESETNACLTLYPSVNYNSIYIAHKLCINLFDLNEPFEIGLKQCHVNIDDKITICLDSLISDSRCPANAVCFWEGNATVKLNYNHDNSNHILNLNTNLQFRNDTTIDRFNIRLLDVMPYPGTEPEQNNNGIRCLVEIKKVD
jgi:hypothetical protein